MNAIGAYGDTALILATKEDNLGVAIALIDLGRPMLPTKQNFPSKSVSLYDSTS